MALVLADRVKETTTTTGTGTVTLLGAVSGFQSFAAVGNGNTTYYTIAGQTTSEWEVGIGTYTSAGTTLSRTTVLASSNAGSLVTFSAGTKDVFVTYPAGRSVYADGTTLTATNNSVLPPTSGGTGQSSYAIGDLLYASTTTALSKLADVATGNALISGGISTAPSWGKIGLTTHVSGTLPIANGGTGTTSTTFVDLTTNVTGTLPVASGGTGAATLTANNVLLGNGTSALQVVAPGTNGNVLTSNGTTWTSAAAGGGFAAGTLMLFQQTSAPTGWTKQTTHDNKALRVVSGSASSGGTTAFTTVFTNQTPTITTSGLSAGATTLTTAQIPSHTHDVNNVALYTGNPGDTLGFVCGAGWRLANTTSTSAGTGGSHTHTISGSATSSAITLNVAYVDLIIASKN